MDLNGQSQGARTLVARDSGPDARGAQRLAGWEEEIGTDPVTPACVRQYSQRVAHLQMDTRLQRDHRDAGPRGARLRQSMRRLSGVVRKWMEG